MPLTFPAHQAVVLPVKLRWPNRCDATALCIESVAPDLGYSVIGGTSHNLIGVVTFAIPFTVVACILLRWRASAAFSFLPDGGPFRVHSYRVIRDRRPPLVHTILSALIDTFTHTGRWGASLLGLNSVLFTLPWRGDITTARLLQYLGHTVGSGAAIVLFLHIGRQHLLEQWYGKPAVGAARAHRPSFRNHLEFWSIVGAVGIVVALAAAAGGGPIVFNVTLGATVGVMVAGCSTRARSHAATPSTRTERSAEQAARQRDRKTLLISNRRSTSEHAISPPVCKFRETPKLYACRDLGFSRNSTYACPDRAREYATNGREPPVERAAPGRDQVRTVKSPVASRDSGSTRRS